MTQAGTEPGALVPFPRGRAIRELPAAERPYGLIDCLAGCLVDDRQAGKVRHSLRDLLAQRIYGLACGYPDANDADRLVLQMGRLEREELRVVVLNTKNVVLRVTTAYQGNVSASLVRVGELFRDAVRLTASGVILVHNHPSGDPTPSPDDLHLTAEALAAGRLLDIAVLDHLVIGHDAYVSMRDRGIAFDRPGLPPAA